MFLGDGIFLTPTASFELFFGVELRISAAFFICGVLLGDAGFEVVVFIVVVVFVLLADVVLEGQASADIVVSIKDGIDFFSDGANFVVVAEDNDCLWLGKEDPTKYEQTIKDLKLKP